MKQLHRWVVELWMKNECTRCNHKVDCWYIYKANLVASSNRTTVRSTKVYIAKAYVEADGGGCLCVTSLGGTAAGRPAGDGSGPLHAEGELHDTTSSPWCHAPTQLAAVISSQLRNLGSKERIWKTTKDWKFKI
jgi:hypothetical protein